MDVPDKNLLDDGSLNSPQPLGQTERGIYKSVFKSENSSCCFEPVYQPGKSLGDVCLLELTTETSNDGVTECITSVKSQTDLRVLEKLVLHRDWTVGHIRGNQGPVVKLVRS
jgi:hypothetical protein